MVQKSNPNALTTLTNDLHGIRFHQHRLQTAMHRRAEYLVQQKVHQAVGVDRDKVMDSFSACLLYSLLIADKAPEIHLQIVCIHLYLLQSKLAERAQANALEQRLWSRTNGEHRESIED